jgi:hypothetical protein
MYSITQRLTVKPSYDILINLVDVIDTHGPHVWYDSYGYVQLMCYRRMGDVATASGEGA